MLKVMYVNINSLYGKLDPIKSYFETYKPDILGIAETKIGDDFDDNELLGSDFSVIRLDRKKGAGGVLLALNNNSAEMKLLGYSTGPGESICATIQLSCFTTFNLILFYRPPSEYSLENFESLLLDNPSKHQNIMFGDLNLPDLDWASNHKGSVKVKSRKFGFHKRALEIINLASMKQFVHQPTHRCGNILDLLLVSKPLLDTVSVRCEVLPAISDHNMLLFDITLPTNFRAKRPPVIRYNYDKADYNSIESEFSKCSNRLAANKLCVEDMWLQINNTITNCLDNHIPTYKLSPKDQPWCDRTLKRLIRKSKNAYNRMIKTPTSLNIQLEKQIAQEVKKKITTAKSRYFETHICKSLSEGNTKPLFAHINKAKGQSNYISSLKDKDYEQIPEELAKHFASVYNDHTYTPPVFECKSFDSMAAIKISEAGVKSYLSSLDPRKSSGPDNVSPMLLKMFSMYVPSFVCCISILFQASLQGGKLPNIWKSAVVTPLHKGGPKNEVNNYRPVSITPILCKCLEHIICSNMWTHADNHDIISNKQHGFRKGFSTTTQLLHVIHNATEAMDKKLDHHIISFDFSKAFDKVPHSLLLQKIRAYKFNDKVCDWIEEWLSDRVSEVSVNGAHSTSFRVLSGVPQGSVLGPLLFLLFIEDMPNRVKFSQCRLYADDTLLCSNYPSPAELQSDVDELVLWACKWGMTFNPLKCTHMQIGKDKPDFDIAINGTAIPSSDNMKYLGVSIDSSLSWDNHIHKIVRKANRQLGMLKRHISLASSQTKLLAFNSIVRTTLEYACQVWSPHKVGLSKLIDNVQRRAVRWIYRLPKICSVTECMCDNGIVSFSLRRIHLDEKFLRKAEAKHYKIDLRDYIGINTHHNTRHKTVDTHHRLNQAKYSYYNRVRKLVNIHFDPSNPSTD